MWYYSGFQITNAPTKGALPPSPVRDLQVTALAPNVFQLSWTATGDDLDDGVGKIRRVFYLFVSLSVSPTCAVICHLRAPSR